MTKSGHPNPMNRFKHDGILVLDKPSGLTSRVVVNMIAHGLPGAKVGHSGTLDPLASGVLIVCVGTATRLVEALQRLPKTYETVVRLGASSTTLDADGSIESIPSPPIPSVAEIENALPSLSGLVLQRPPEFSALKIRGKRAYSLARSGMQVQLAPRLVQIDQITLLTYEWPRLKLRVDCGSGTYIRSIARDLGEFLRCGGFVEELIRTRIGPFTLADAVNPAALSTPEAIDAHLRPPVEAVADLPRIVLNPEQIEAVACGRRLASTDLGTPLELDGEVALLSEDGSLVGLAQANVREGWVQPRKVFWVKWR
jgi:tRNA pseudouridine55 synthase